MLDVAVNLLWCVPGQVGGSEDYLARQLLGLHEVRAEAPELRVTAFAPRGFAAARPDVAAAVRVVEAGIDGTSRPRRIVAESTWLHRRTAGFGLVHHGGGTLPLRMRRPTVLTIHDLQHLKHPEYLTAVKRAYLRAALPRSARRADVITVPSAYVRGTVVDAYGIAEERVVVVPHGIEPALGAHATPEDELRARYGLGRGPVVVMPAITHPHKGHRFLLDVMAASWPDPDLRLVLVGGEGAVEAEVMRAASRPSLAGRVVRTGRVPANDRDGLLRMATAMVFPSEYEGFGAPVAEAMTLGVPVVCSDRAGLPEVAGDAALVLPLEREAWAGALDHVRAHADEMRAAGRRRAADFTTAESARALLRAYRSAVA